MRRTVSSTFLTSMLLGTSIFCGCRTMMRETSVALLPPYRNGDAPRIEAKGDPFLTTEPTNSPSPNVVEFVDDEASQSLWD